MIKTTFLRHASKKHLRQLPDPTVRAVFLGDYVSEEIILKAIYERRELNALVRNVFSRLPSDSTALDIGANIGNHTACFADYFSRVVAFEPNPIVAAILKVNAEIMRRQGKTIDVAEMGLSDVSGKRSFHICHHNLGASRVVTEETGMTIEVRSLDYMALELQLTNVRFVKIDVEGHEAEIIEGARDLLSSARPVIALEGFYKDRPIHGLRVTELLRDYGYRHFYCLSDRKAGESQFLYSLMRKYYQRRRKLSLTKVQGLSGENHAMAIITADRL